MRGWSAGIWMGQVSNRSSFIFLPFLPIIITNISYMVTSVKFCSLFPDWYNYYLVSYYSIIWVTLSESFWTSIRGFSGSNHEDIFWNFPNWSTSNLRNWVSIYRQPQADCLYHINCLYNFPAYTWRQKRNAFPGLCSGSIFMIQKNLIIILGTEPRILCSEVIRKNNSSMTQLIIQCSQLWPTPLEGRMDVQHHRSKIMRGNE